MFKKINQWLHKKRYYQVGFVNPKTLHEQKKEKVMISYDFYRKKNRTYKLKFPIEKAKREYMRINKSWLENEYQEGLTIMECIKVIDVDNVQVHPHWRQKALIRDCNGVIQVKLRGIDDGRYHYEN